MHNLRAFKVLLANKILLKCMVLNLFSTTTCGLKLIGIQFKLRPAKWIKWQCPLWNFCLRISFSLSLFLTSSLLWIYILRLYDHEYSFNSNKIGFYWATHSCESSQPFDCSYLSFFSCCIFTIFMRCSTIFNAYCK